MPWTSLNWHCLPCFVWPASIFVACLGVACFGVACLFCLYKKLCSEFVIDKEFFEHFSHLSANKEARLTSLTAFASTALVWLGFHVVWNKSKKTYIKYSECTTSKYTNLSSEFVVDKEFSEHFPHLPAKKEARLTEWTAFASTALVWLGFHFVWNKAQKHT